MGRKRILECFNPSGRGSVQEMNRSLDLMKDVSALEMPEPQRCFSLIDTMAIMIGVVVGAGIFRTPSIVAANSGTLSMTLLVWFLGGAISLMGALCYAELASTYPHPGGDYHYIGRAYGRAPAFLFGWSRMMVIQTGSIAMLAFLIGEYASEVFRLGPYSTSLYATGTIALITAVNMLGIRQGSGLQKFLTAMLILGLGIIIVTGFALPDASRASISVPPQNGGSIGKAMIFALLTYGGWNEASYLSAEVRGSCKNVARALLYGIGAITFLYLAINWAYLQGLGFAAASQSEVVATDLMRRAFGEVGSKAIGLMISLAALSTMNAVMITGARTNYALGRDYPSFRLLGKWNEGNGVPGNALLVQGIISLALVAFGSGTRNGFETMVEYTAPVFWFFFLLSGVSLFVLRRKEPEIARPFRVPLYPLTPIFFCLTCFYMLQSSVMVTGVGALIGLAVLVAGALLFLLARIWHKERIGI